MTTRLSDLGISTTGNITSDTYFIGNGSQLTGIGAVDFTAVTTDIIPVSNVDLSLGNSTNQWKDLWVSNATIYLNSIPLGIGNTGALQFDGNDIVTSGPNVINTGNVETTGDVIGGNLVIATGGVLTFADGSTQISAYGNTNVEAYLPTSNTIISINSNIANTNSNVANLTVTVDNQANAIANLQGVVYTDSNVTTLLSSGNVTTNILTTANVSAGGTIYGTNIETTGTATANIFNLANAGNLTFSSIQQNQNPPYGSQAYGIEMLTTTTDPSVFSSVAAGPDYVSLKSTNAGNANVIVQGGYGVTIQTSNASGGSIKEWTFTAGGATLFPGSFSTSGNVLAPNFSATGNILTDGLISTAGNIISGNFSTAGNITTGGMYSTGDLSVAGNISVNGNIRSGSFIADFGLVVTGDMSATGNVYSAYVYGNGSQLTGLPAGYANANVTSFLASNANVTITTTGAITTSANVSAGNVTTTGRVNATGNVSAGNVTTTGRVSATGNVYSGNVFALAPAGASFNVGDYFSNGTIVTLDYIGIGQASFPVGSTITVTNGVEVPGLNGTYVVTAASADQCSFLNNTVASTGNVPTGFSNTFPTVTGVNSAVISTTGNVAFGGYAIGDGGLLGNITGANVTGEVARANTVTNPLQPNITALGTITSLTANSVTVNGQFTANGNAQFNQDVYFAGNVTLPGNITQISGNSGSFFGNAVTGFGALYAGLPAGYTLLNQEITQFAASYNGYSQVSLQNINGGDQATGDFVITADNGNDFTNHIDLGVAGSGYNGLLANNSLGTSLYANDG